MYTLFENTWHAHLLSSTPQELSLFFVENRWLCRANPTVTHLPSFSSAIMHLGICRDLFFVFLEIALKQDSVSDEGKIIQTLKAPYQQLQKFKAAVSQLSSEADYLRMAEEFHRQNRFRNFFAHRLRIPWWHSEACPNGGYFVPRTTYDALKKDDKRQWPSNLLRLFDDHEAFEREIAEANIADLVSAREILQDIHGETARFLNKSFGLLHLP
jgi:hypothetical protein